MLLIAILIGALLGAITFFVVAVILPFGGNLSGLIGLMILPVGVIVGAVLGGIYWVERPRASEHQDENKLNE